MQTKAFVTKASLESITLFGNVAKKNPTLVCPCQVARKTPIFIEVWLDSNHLLCHFFDKNNNKKFTVFHKKDLIFPTN